MSVRQYKNSSNHIPLIIYTMPLQTKGKISNEFYWRETSLRTWKNKAKSLKFQSISLPCLATGDCIYCSFRAVQNIPHKSTETVMFVDCLQSLSLSNFSLKHLISKLTGKKRGTGRVGTRRVAARLFSSRPSPFYINRVVLRTWALGWEVDGI